MIDSRILILSFIIIFFFALGIVVNTFFDAQKILSILNTGLLLVLVLRDYSKYFKPKLEG